MSYADVLRPTWKRYALLYDTVCVVGGSMLIALAARVSIFLPGNPVPITGQTLAVLLIGATLGSRRGFLCLLLYLMEGCAGLPVFSGGAAGLARLIGPTGGYLVGMVVAAFIVGLLAERGWDRRIGTAMLAMLIGNIVIYAFGLPWLALFVGSRALALGLLPFIPGDFIKLLMATLLLPLGWRALGK